MHALRQFIQQRMDARGWKPADLVRASSLSKQLVQQLLDDDRDRLASSPRPATVTGIARAFNVPEASVMVAVFDAMGYDLGAARVHVDLSVVPSVELLRALAERLGVSMSDEGARHDATANARAEVSSADYGLAARRGEVEQPYDSQE